MQHTRENLPGHMVKLTVTLDPTEIEPQMKRAAEEISRNTKIDGFRPGHAPYEVIKQRVGEMRILEVALQPLIQKSLLEAVHSEDLKTVGSPEVNIEKAAPQNPVVYSARLALMPEVTKLADLAQISVAKKTLEIPGDKIDAALKDLQKMQATETRVDRAAGAEDKIVVDFTMSKQHVPIDGGVAKDHAIFLAENYYIPGLKEQLIGMKAGDSKQFTLKFPEEHAQKMLAGADIDYDVTAKEVFEMTFPALDDAFTKKLGKETVAELRALVQQNMETETKERNDRDTEVELLEAIAAKSEFTDIPQTLIDHETDAMFHELEREIEGRGIPFEDYLRDLQKTEADMKKDFESQAMTRVKVALALAKCADTLNIQVEESEIDQAIDAMAAQYKDPKIREQIFSPQYREHEAVILRNKKTIEKLKETMVK